jgi:DNA-binding CsgD family transcriptional regulator
MPANYNGARKRERDGASPIARRKSRLPDLLSSEEWCRLCSALQLSTRQAQILKWAFSDERDSAIAEHLGLSTHTIHTQRMRLFRKLGVTTMAQVISLAATIWFELNVTCHDTSHAPGCCRCSRQEHEHARASIA